MVERILGKDEVTSSILVISSIIWRHSSVGQSKRFIPAVSAVQIRVPPPILITRSCRNECMSFFFTFISWWKSVNLLTEKSNCGIIIQWQFSLLYFIVRKRWQECACWLLWPAQNASRGIIRPTKTKRTILTVLRLKSIANSAKSIQTIKKPNNSWLGSVWIARMWNDDRSGNNFC